MKEGDIEYDVWVIKKYQRWFYLSIFADPDVILADSGFIITDGDQT